MLRDLEEKILRDVAKAVGNVEGFYVGAKLGEEWFQEDDPGGKVFTVEADTAT